MQCLEFQVGVLLMEEMQCVALWLKIIGTIEDGDFSTWSWAQNPKSKFNLVIFKSITYLQKSAIILFLS